MAASSSSTGPHENDLGGHCPVDLNNEPLARATEQIALTIGNEEVLRAPHITSQAKHLWDGVDTSHVKAGHQPFDATCTKCLEAKSKARLHKRGEELDLPGQVSVDFLL